MTEAKIKIGEIECAVSQAAEALGAQLTAHRRARIDQVLHERTRAVIPVLEDIYDRGNASAVMRSAEGHGFHEIHMVESGEKFKEANRVTKGADQWLDIHKWKTTEDCVGHLRGRGYQICVTSLEAAVPIAEIDFSKPTAVVFGNEKDGASRQMLELADQRFILPMHGFVQSFNISVAAAISFYHIYCERVRKLGYSGDLGQAEKEHMRVEWYMKSIRRAEEILARKIKG